MENIKSMCNIIAILVTLILTQDNICELYLACATLQERAILHIAYGCGLRVSEVSALNVDDVRTAENMVTVRSGKMGKRRLVPMNDAISADLKEFILYLFASLFDCFGRYFDLILTCSCVGGSVGLFIGLSYFFIIRF